MDASQLRRAFTEFFVERGHVSVPSASLIPHDQTVLFTVAGMVQFKPYFLGDEPAPFKRATTIQKCVRAGGKHNDLDQIGLTSRHLTFFEMLGNFSFGDYFKEQAIPYAWELVTDVLKLDPNRLWITVHLSDDEAEVIWRDQVGVPQDRIQRLDEDNWWQMSDTGPCGPCSEIYYDKGESFGAAGGPAFGSDERFMEIWNLVFMQYDRQPDGSLVPLPKPCIDTGAGFERILPVIQGKGSVYDTDLLQPILKVASEVTKVSYGADPSSDVKLRIMADHARSMTFLVSDGVFPTNESRGYVLRRIIRRAVLRSYQLGTSDLVTPKLIQAVIDTMGEAYPELISQRNYIISSVQREEEKFRQTLQSGIVQLEEELKLGSVSGEVAFRLHDTCGFPIELTKEISNERGVAVDMEGFDILMSEQRTRARAAGLGVDVNDEETEHYRSLLDGFGSTLFTGHETTSDHGRLLAFSGPKGDEGYYELFFDRTPFYPEGGGQVGDTGVVLGDSLEFEVVDTSYVAGSLVRHRANLTKGIPVAGELLELRVDKTRREAVRRNHTGTHLLHWALRKVLGDHVRQQGSLVAPDRLRFDFTHFSPMSAEEKREVEALVNAEIIANVGVETDLMAKDDAMKKGAMAFFGDKYGDVVRVVRAGTSSIELCGGTHVGSLGAIGLFLIVSEASIGSNTRRIEAVTGNAALERVWGFEDVISDAAIKLKVSPSEVSEKIEQLRSKERELQDQLKGLNKERLTRAAASAVVTAGYCVLRQDGLSPEDLRELALMIRSRSGARVIVAAGSPGEGRASIVCAVDKDSGLIASEIIRDAAGKLGGGVGRQVEVATAGGKNVGRLDEVLIEIEGNLRSTIGDK